MQILYFYLRRLTLCYYELYYKSWFLKNSKTDHSWTTPISSSSIVVVARSGHDGAKELIYWPKQNSESISRRLDCATMKKEKYKIDKMKSWPISIQLSLFIRCWFFYAHSSVFNYHDNIITVKSPKKSIFTDGELLAFKWPFQTKTTLESICLRKDLTVMNHNL